MSITRKIDNHRINSVESTIYLIRGQRVMLDSDLAAIYGVTTKRLNEQLKRTTRVSRKISHLLTAQEFTNLKSQFATSNSHTAERII